MERIICSNSMPSKLDSPFSRRFAQVELVPKVGTNNWTGKFPFLPRLDSRRLNSPSSYRCGPAFLSLTPKSVKQCTEIAPAHADSLDGPEHKHHFLKQIALKLSQQQKVFNAGKVILLSAVCLTLFHAAIVSSALASFQSAGGPAAVSAGGSLIRAQLLSSVWTGFLAGCLHTLSGPDHLAALAPLAIGLNRMESAAVGALWGCGHDAGQLMFGLLFLLLKDQLHIEVIRTWGTRVVGLTLLVIGAMGIREASEVPAPCVAMEIGEGDAGGFEAMAIPSTGKKKIGFATFATGIVHGLQPDALMIILPALALPSRLAGAAFLFMFLVGTVVAMGSYTVFIGSCSQALKDRVPRITEKLTWASSLVAIAFGLSIILGEFFGFSLY